MGQIGNDGGQCWGCCKLRAEVDKLRKGLERIEKMVPSSFKHVRKVARAALEKKPE